jgi:sensor histidine kinase regulating citrate/malate metabolism
MKSNTFNNLLMVIVAVLVLAIFGFSWLAVTRVHNTRNLSQLAMQHSQILSKTENLLANLDAYNRQHPSLEITAILKSFQKPAAK